MPIKFDPAAAIRTVAKTIAWITAFVAPIKGVYEYVHGGHLAANGISTQLSLWQVLWNLAINFGYFILLFSLIFIVGCCIIGFPVLLVASFIAPEEVKKENSILNKWIIGVVAVLVGPLVLLLLAGAVGDSLASQNHSFVDGILGIIGGVFLFSIYFYVYMAATGNIEKEKAS